MKLQVMSDLHIAHWGHYLGTNYWSRTFPEQTQTTADVLILAGDCVDLRRRDWRWSVARLQEFAVRYKNVVYVPGNHEFYNTNIADIDLTKLEQESGVNVLRPGKVVEIDGQRFLGGVMFQPGGTEEDELGKISDHWCIADFYEEAPGEYHRLRRFLDDELKSSDIVVTHHAPSAKSLDDRWKGNPCNRWFITAEMEPLIVERQPRLWVHGHTHTPFDYRIGETRVLCNPMGYPGEHARFDPKLVVKI